TRARDMCPRGKRRRPEPLRRLTVRSPNCCRGVLAAARSASCSRRRCLLCTPPKPAAPRDRRPPPRAALGVSPDFTQRLRRGFDRPPRPVRGLSRFWTTATESLHQKGHLTWVGRLKRKSRASKSLFLPISMPMAATDRFVLRGIAVLL